VVAVFTAQPLRGHPVAVVLDAPGADYRLRIFSPGGDLPFAGHPQHRVGARYRCNP